MTLLDSSRIFGRNSMTKTKSFSTSTWRPSIGPSSFRTACSAFERTWWRRIRRTFQRRKGASRGECWGVEVSLKHYLSSSLCFQVQNHPLHDSLHLPSDSPLSSLQTHSQVPGASLINRNLLELRGSKLFESILCALTCVPVWCYQQLSTTLVINVSTYKYLLRGILSSSR